MGGGYAEPVEEGFGGNGRECERRRRSWLEDVGRLAVRMRVLELEEVAGASGTRYWTKCGKIQCDGVAACLDGEQAGGTKSARRALLSWMSVSRCSDRGSEEVEGEGEHAAQTSVARDQQATETTELDVLPGAVQVDGRFAREAERASAEVLAAPESGAESGFDAQGAGVRGLVSVRTG